MSPTSQPHPSQDPAGVTERKAALRTQVRAARRERLARHGSQGRDADAASMARLALTWLRALPARPHQGAALAGRCVTAYDPLPAEPPIAAFVQVLREHGVRVLVPVTLGEGRLGWRDVDAAPPTQNPMLPQTGEGPAVREEEALADVDAAFIPALAVSAQGRRLGQGGGYFDRTVPALRRQRPDTPVVAVVYPDELGIDVPTRAHDIAVDAVLTPQGITAIPGPGPAAT